MTYYEYPDAQTIRERLPYSAPALGFSDGETYEAILEELRTEEIDRIESWGDVVADKSAADRLHDGSDPRVAFEEFNVEHDIDGSHAVQTPREVPRYQWTRTGDRYHERSQRHPRDRKRRLGLLPLPGRPVADVDRVSLIDRDADLEVGEDVYLEGDAVLVLDEYAPIVEWPRGRRNIRVKYTFGTDGVPGRVRSALVDLVHFRLVNDQSLGVDSESIGGDNVTYTDADEILRSAFESVVSETEDSRANGVFSV